MACNVVRDKDGRAVGFACTRGQRLKRCFKCGRPGAKLCDFKLTGPMAGKTCDMSLCELCATHVEPDTDYCPAHARMMGLPDK